jgi:hypothetical protein
MFICYDIEMVVPHPSVDKLLVKLYSLLQTFVPSLIISIRVKAICTISRCNQVDNSLIPPIS